jgi:antitoxin HicB
MRYVYPYVTQGDTEKEAAAMAEDALVTALSFYTDHAEPLPCPSPAHSRPLAYVPPLVAAKLALHDAMLAAGVSNVALARQLGTDEKTVRRLRDPLHQSRINQVDAALRALGKRVGIVIEAA